MAYQTQLVLIFGLGVVAEALYLIRRNFGLADLIKLFICMLIAVYGFLENEGGFYEGFMWYYFLFSVMFAYLFHDKVLPRIDENILLIWNIIFWYLYLTQIGFSLLGLVFLGPTLIILANAFLPYAIPKSLKIILYVWFLSMVVFLAVFQFNPDSFSIFSDVFPRSINTTPIESFIMGMVFLYITVHAAYVLNLIPLPGDSQSFRERWQEVKSWALKLGERYSDEQIRPFRAIFIIASFGGALLLNLYFKFVSDYLIINLGLIIYSFRLSQEPVLKMDEK